MGAEALTGPPQVPSPFYTVGTLWIPHHPEEPGSQTEAPAREAGGAGGWVSPEEQGWGHTACPWGSEKTWEGAGGDVAGVQMPGAYWELRPSPSGPSAPQSPAESSKAWTPKEIVLYEIPTELGEKKGN